MNRYAVESVLNRMDELNQPGSAGVTWGDLPGKRGFYKTAQKFPQERHRKALNPAWSNDQLSDYFRHPDTDSLPSFEQEPVVVDEPVSPSYRKPQKPRFKSIAAMNW